MNTDRIGAIMGRGVYIIKLFTLVETSMNETMTIIYTSKSDLKTTLSIGL